MRVLSRTHVQAPLLPEDANSASLPAAKVDAAGGQPRRRSGDRVADN